MRECPDYIVEGIAVLVGPHIGRRPEESEVRRLLDQLRSGKPATLSTWANRYGIKAGTLRARLRAKGISPCGLEANRELYSAAQIAEVCPSVS